MAERGRPPKLTEFARTRFLEAIKEGDTIANACAYSGIAVSTFFAWQAYAREGQGRGTRKVIVDFLDSYRVAAAEAMTEAVREVRKAGRGEAPAHRTIRTLTHPDGKVEVIEEVTMAPPEWRASAWYLERRAPKMWGRRDRTPVDVNEEAERIARELDIPVDELWAEAELMAQSE